MLKQIVLGVFALCGSQSAFAFNWSTAKFENIEFTTDFSFYKAIKKNTPEDRQYLGTNFNNLLLFGNPSMAESMISVLPYKETHYTPAKVSFAQFSLEVSTYFPKDTLEVSFDLEPVTKNRTIEYKEMKKVSPQFKTAFEKKFASFAEAHIKTLAKEDFHDLDSFKKYLEALVFTYNNVEPDRPFSDLITDQSSPWSVFPFKLHELTVDCRLSLSLPDKSRASDNLHPLSVDDSISSDVLPENGLWQMSDLDGKKRLDEMEHHGVYNYPTLYSFFTEVQGFSPSMPKLAAAAKKYIRYEITERQRWSCEGEVSDIVNYQWVLNDGSLLSFHHTPECD